MELSNQAIKDLKSDFWSYIEILQEFRITKEKSKINDLYQKGTFKRRNNK